MSFQDFSKGTPPDDDTDVNGGSGGGGGGGAVLPIPIIGGRSIRNNTSDPSDFLVNYNERFEKADVTLYRDAVIAQTLSVLIGKNKPNAMLVGPAGTGKTRIVEDIARRIANSDPSIPEKLANATVYELPLSSIVAGSGIVGDIEQKVNDVVEFLSDPDNDAILFIDEIHMLAHKHDSYGTIAQILKPALARGDIRCIGATTSQEAQDITEDPAFNRRFSRVIVDELTREQTCEVLRSAWASFSNHYQGQIDINDTTIPLICAIADQYSTAGSHRPDNALTLLDRVCGESIVDRASRAAKTADATISQAILSTPVKITENKVRSCAMKIATGQAKQSRVDFDSLDERMSHLFGQDEPKRIVRRLIKTTELDLFPRKQPVTILCAGPSGVGKSEIARIVAREMCGAEPIMLNMTEYNDPATVNRIIGSPAGYVGSDSHSELPFDCLESNPYQVILLDEMEKADKSVQRLFMGAFDDGFIKTSKGKVVDFSKAIIFVTTNASHTTGKHNAAGFTTQATSTLSDTVSDLSQWFDVEFLNRFKTILTFEEISPEMYRAIVADKYDTESERIRRDNPRINIPEHLDDDQLDRIVAETYVPKFGARPANRAVQQTIEDMVCAP